MTESVCPRCGRIPSFVDFDGVCLNGCVDHEDVCPRCGDPACDGPDDCGGDPREFSREDEYDRVRVRVRARWGHD